MKYSLGAVATVGAFISGKSRAAICLFATPRPLLPPMLTHDPTRHWLWVQLQIFLDRTTLHVVHSKHRRRRWGAHSSPKSPGQHAINHRHHDASLRRRDASCLTLSSHDGTAGLPRLDGGMPGKNEPFVLTGASTSQRSRKGKYPVIELWRRGEMENVRHMQENGRGIQESGYAIQDSGYDIQEKNGQMEKTAEQKVTALAHLQAALGLRDEQTNAVLEAFPALAELHPDKLDVRAKLLFIRYTMLAEEMAVVVSFPRFFGHPLERLIAPRHAFLVASGRPSGAKLVVRGCRGLRRMVEFPANRFVAEMVPGRNLSEYRRFEQAFLKGPFDAARRGDAETLHLLRSHGWDCWETDRRGRTALFWAAGGGSVDACEALTEGEGGLRPCAQGGDGCSPLHWAAAGVEAKRFGTGGNVDMCRWLLKSGADPKAKTDEGNTVVMWAAWAGGLEVTRWAVEEAAADLSVVNENGCSVAHWAASGGDEAVCRYLHANGVDFSHKNNAGNDPLNHAVAYGRRNIATWLLKLPDQSKPVRSGIDVGVGKGGGGASQRRRRDDPVLLDLARLTGDDNMAAFLLSDGQ